jgi:uncharacterized protein (DUF1015 family)
MSSEPVRPAGDGARPLRLAPFRALRYNAELVPDLGAVTCPPYDVIDADRITRWEATDRYNVVRLILPRDRAAADRHAHAACNLRQWLSEGLLVQDANPALYVYEQVAGEGVAVGLVGAVSLHDYDERRILPHEDVFPGPVADRTDLMATTEAQLEPILLTYDGDGAASDVVDAALDEPPTVEAHTADGTRHRLWRVTGAEALRVVERDLAERQALIADGHHRYAAYLALRDRWARHDGTGSDASYGLAMLVDARRHPLRLGAIHRSVAGLGWQAAVDAVRRAFRTVRPLPAADATGVAAELAVAQAGGTSAVFAVTDGTKATLLAEPDPRIVADSMPLSSSELWRRLPASIARDVVLGRLWQVDDADPRVSYHHHAADAAARAVEAAGIALLLTPADLADVMALAAQGERMPRKSTSFGPKPRTGLLMRLLADRPHDAGSSGSSGSAGGR